MDGANNVEEFEDDDSDGWEECDDADVEMQKVICLFCDVTFPDAVSTFVHCSDAHNFNICVVRKLHSLDCIAYIKLVNFIRRNASCDFVLDLIRTVVEYWS